MVKRRKTAAIEAGGEIDYLAPAQLEVDPNSFESTVREAYRLEHDCIQRQDIAEVLGVDKSRISQIFKNPEKLKPETIHSLLQPLRSAAHRKRIVRAWTRTCFGNDFEEAKQHTRLTVVSQQTIKQIDRQVKEYRLWTALEVVEEALSMTKDPFLTDLLLDRAYFLQFRLNLPGHAMTTARHIAAQGFERREARRHAMGYAMRARILISLLNSTPGEVDRAVRDVERLVQTCSPLYPPIPKYLVAKDSAAAGLRENALLTFAERGIGEVSQGELWAILAAHRAAAKPSQSYQSRFEHLHIAARCLNLLGEPFQALELIDQSFAAGTLKNVNALELCGLLQARLLAKTEDHETAASHYRSVSRNCGATQDLRHRLLAETELARLESSAFTPVSTPTSSSTIAQGKSSRHF